MRSSFQGQTLESVCKKSFWRARGKKSEVRSSIAREFCSGKAWISTSC